MYGQNERRLSYKKFYFNYQHRDILGEHNFKNEKHFKHRIHGVIEIKIKDTNIHLGFISAQTHVPT